MSPELAGAMRRIPLFAALPPALLDEIGGLCGVRRVRKGELLFSEGDPAGSLPLLLSGRVKLARTGADGREQILHIIRGPASFAEAAVFGPGVFPAATTAIEDGVLATLDRAALLDLLRLRPEVALALLASMSLWMRRLADLVEGLALHTVEERVAAYLWSAFVRSAGAPARGTEIRLSEPKRLIAALCGTAPEVLSRTFRRFAEGGVVRVSGPNATLLDPGALARLAGIEEDQPLTPS
jgi:CRP/FNR family transcriptional regulator, dissimilatory nitrate respiration regulator